MGGGKAVKRCQKQRVITSFPLFLFEAADHETDGDGQSDECKDAIGKVALNPDEVACRIIEVDNKEPDTPGNEQ
jgi:hypothetical protein